MKYLLLIYVNESDEGETAPEVYEEYGRVVGEIREAGAWLEGEELKPTSTATSVRVRNGKTETTDGPFAETKEALGGFFLIDCADLDQALGYAARIPAAASGTIEVRPINEM